MAPARKFILLVDAQLVNFGTVKSGRDQRVFGVGDDLILLLRLCHALRERGERAKTQPAPERRRPGL